MGYDLKKIEKIKAVIIRGSHKTDVQVQITNQGSLKIGKISMQRKGGDAGRKTSQMLQFKINPTELFKSS